MQLLFLIFFATQPPKVAHYLIEVAKELAALLGISIDEGTHNG